MANGTNLFEDVQDRGLAGSAWEYFGKPVLESGAKTASTAKGLMFGKKKKKPAPGQDWTGGVGRFGGPPGPGEEDMSPQIPAPEQPTAIPVAPRMGTPPMHTDVGPHGWVEPPRAAGELSTVHGPLPVTPGQGTPRPALQGGFAQQGVAMEGDTGPFALPRGGRFSMPGRANAQLSRFFGTDVGAMAGQAMGDAAADERMGRQMWQQRQQGQQTTEMLQREQLIRGMMDEKRQRAIAALHALGPYAVTAPEGTQLRRTYDMLLQQITGTGEAGAGGGQVTQTTNATAGQPAQQQGTRTATGPDTRPTASFPRTFAHVAGPMVASGLGAGAGSLVGGPAAPVTGAAGGIAGYYGGEALANYLDPEYASMQPDPMGKWLGLAGGVYGGYKGAQGIRGLKTPQVTEPTGGAQAGEAVATPQPGAPPAGPTPSNVQAAPVRIPAPQAAGVGAGAQMAPPATPSPTGEAGRHMAQQFEFPFAAQQGGGGAAPAMAPQQRPTPTTPAQQGVRGPMQPAPGETAPWETGGGMPVEGMERPVQAPFRQEPITYSPLDIGGGVSPEQAAAMDFVMQHEGQLTPDIMRRILSGVTPKIGPTMTPQRLGTTPSVMKQGIQEQSRSQPSITGAAGSSMSPQTAQQIEQGEAVLRDLQTPESAIQLSTASSELPIPGTSKGPTPAQRARLQGKVKKTLKKPPTEPPTEQP